MAWKKYSEMSPDEKKASWKKRSDKFNFKKLSAMRETKTVYPNKTNSGFGGRDNS